VLIGVDQPDCSLKKIDDQNVDRDQRRRADDLLLSDLVAASNHLLSVSDRHVPSQVWMAFKRRGSADATRFHNLTPAFFPVLGTDALPKTL
jgi:hypothetical protein